MMQLAALIPKAMELGISYAPPAPWWSSFKDWAAILSPLISLAILTCTLGLQKYYRDKDRISKARSAAYYVALNLEEWGNTFAIAAGQWTSKFDGKSYGKLNTDALPVPTSFQHLRDLHEMEIDHQEVVVKASTLMSDIYNMAKTYNSRGEETKDWETYNFITTGTCVEGAIRTIAAAMVLKSAYKLPPVAVATVDRMVALKAWREMKDKDFQQVFDNLKSPK